MIKDKIQTVKIFLGDQEKEIANLYYNLKGNRESCAFEYQQNWIKTHGSFALEKNLPLVYGPQYHKMGNTKSIFPNILSDTEPDGWAKQVILRDYKKNKNSSVSSLNSLDFLLMVDDFSRIGALRLQNEKGEFTRSNLPPIIELKKILKATNAIESHCETMKDLEYLRGKATSLGGMRPKCSIIEEDGSLSLAKFPSVTDERSISAGEILALRLAKKAGINAADARLLTINNTQIAIIKRFDRDLHGNRILYASAATILGAQTIDSNKLFTYTDIVDEMRRISIHAQEEIEELWRRIAFSILINNVDDHLHNHGFLHVENGFWTLSKAFDINPFPDKIRSLKTWISEKTGPDTSIEALLSVNKYFQISNDKAMEMLNRINNVIKNWKVDAKNLGMSSKDIKLYEDAFSKIK